MNPQNQVIAANFERDSNTYEALTDLKELDAQGQVGFTPAPSVMRRRTSRKLPRACRGWTKRRLWRDSVVTSAPHRGSAVTTPHLTSTYEGM
jgi:hypothetical protein